MESQLLPWSLTTLILPLPILFLIKKWKKAKLLSVADLPPGPKKLPIIGNLHQISLPPFRSFRDLSQRYGPIMHLKMGEVDAIVVSSPEIAKEIMKENDLVFTNRPESIALKIFWYNYIDIAFSPYGEYWRQMRKICILELLSARSVRSFASIRKDEVYRLVQSLRLSAPGEAVNLTQKLFSFMSSVTCRAAFGKVCKDKESLIGLIKKASEMGAGFLIADIFPSSVIANALSWRTKRRLMRMRRKLDVILDGIIREHETIRKDSGRGNGEFGNEDLVDVLLRVKETGEMEFPIGYDNIKAVLLDMFAAGTETAASTMDWAMAELVRNPRVMAKAQAKVREMAKERGVEEEDVKKLSYLKLVIMETLRLHPQGAIIPRVPRATCQVSGYTILEKMKVLVNAWAIHRDPEHWDDPESFEPERFQNQVALDYKGNDFRYLPFGSGKRMCPGVAFGSTSVALPLAHLLNNFDWKLPEGVDARDMNMMESSALTSFREESLSVVATPYQLSP